MCTSSSTFTSASTLCASHKSAPSTAPASFKQSDATSVATVNHGAPQCCHCGWRGSHSPNCPFK
ncbi:hypothetical protein BDQ12DRAFT_677783 [Crucibulum laeve]|uniref:Uncharacterized protein n=1 Tax=Crucibulum laeve TaxID=68775 RepID=A0A5C3M9R6_9AGAR|nr:hypothetical protein BDQ12DRAFT_677783 [Crucibulum laeve]